MKNLKAINKRIKIDRFLVQSSPCARPGMGRQSRPQALGDPLANIEVTESDKHWLHN